MADEKNGIATGYNNELIQQYLNYADNALGAKQKANQKSLDKSQSVMYDALGKMQLQTERDIAKRRIQAQRSGMTSSQLAAFEMQNIMTGQLGAQQIAQQYRQEQAALEGQYAGAQDETRAALFEVLNNNKSQAAAVDAQKFAASMYKQAEELYPDATKEQIDALSRRMMGHEMSKEDKKIINSIKGFSSGYGKIVSEINTLGFTSDQNAYINRIIEDYNADFGPVQEGVLRAIMPELSSEAQSQLEKLISERKAYQ